MKTKTHVKAGGRKTGEHCNARWVGRQEVAMRTKTRVKAGPRVRTG